MGSKLRKGQRLRPLHPALAEREWGVSGDAVGTCLCSYSVLVDRSGATDRVDVRFASGTMAWGAPATEFAVIGEGKAAN